MYIQEQADERDISEEDYVEPSARFYHQDDEDQDEISPVQSPQSEARVREKDDILSLEENFKTPHVATIGRLDLTFNSKTQI